MIERLGVVDQSPIASGTTATQALHNTLDLARRCEALGYHRYWLAEHHSSQALAGSAPEILTAHVAAATTSMRIGSGGVMLTHYSAYKVAEQWRTLHSLHPGRIDLGVGRAPGSDHTTAAALAKGPGALSAEHYPAQVRELRDFLNDRPNPAGAFRDVRAQPITPDAPPIHVLASSEGSAGIAAHLGLPLVWAHFIAFEHGGAIVDAYRRQYEPSERWPEPTVIVAASAICADSGAEADRLADSLRAWRASGLAGPIPEPDPASTSTAATTADVLRIRHRDGRPLIHGDAERVKAELESLAESFGAAEMLVVTITHDHQARVRSYELLARAFGLASATGTPASE